MSYIIEAFTALVTSLLVGAVFLLISREKKKAAEEEDRQRFTMRQPKAMFVSGVGITLIIVWLARIMSVHEDQSVMIWRNLVLGGIALFGTSVALHAAYWRVDVSDDHIYICELFRRQKELSFSEITEIRKGEQPDPFAFSGSNYIAIKVYAGKRKIFTINSYCRGFEYMLYRLKKTNLTFYPY